MTEFELRYNSMEHAKLLVLQRLILEVADMKGEGALEWIDGFRNAVVSEIGDTMTDQTGSPAPRPDRLRSATKNIVQGLTDMAKHRLEQRRAR